MQTVPSGALEACRCIFEYNSTKWYDTSWPQYGSVSPAGTCFEYTRVVNDIDPTQRQFAIKHLDPVADYYACTYGPPGIRLDFEYTVKETLYTTGYWPRITGQLTTMAKDDCGLTAGAAEFREAFLDDATNTWLVNDELGDPIARISDNPGGKILRVWAFDEDGDGLEDLLIWWDKAIAWVAHGPFDLADPVPPPDL